MTTKKRQCAGTNASGEQCASPIVGTDGYCAAHRPGGDARMRELAMRGALASQKPKGVDPEVLGPLRTHDDAQRWLEEIGRAVVVGHLQDRPARAGIQAVEAWVRVEGERLTMEVVEDLRSEVERLKREVASRQELRALG